LGGRENPTPTLIEKTPRIRKEQEKRKIMEKTEGGSRKRLNSPMKKGETVYS